MNFSYLKATLTFFCSTIWHVYHACDISAKTMLVIFVLFLSCLLGRDNWRGWGRSVWTWFADRNRTRPSRGRTKTKIQLQSFDSSGVYSWKICINISGCEIFVIVSLTIVRLKLILEFSLVNPWTQWELDDW